MSTTEITTLAATKTTVAAGHYRSWLCVVCGFIYNELDGIPGEGIPAGTKWEDVPSDWVCNDCGVGKADFEMIEL